MKRVIVAVLVSVLAGASASAQGPAKLPDYKKEAVKA